MKVTNYQSATIDPFGKGLGMVPGTGIQLGDAGRLDWNLLDEDVSLPAAVLYADRIEHNLKWMQAFVAEYGVKLAPHGKTTMAPQAVPSPARNRRVGHHARDRASGARGVSRRRAARALANQLVGKREHGLIAELLTDPNFEFFCLVDSADGVDQLGEFFSDREEAAERADRARACRAGAPACATTRSAKPCSPPSRVAGHDSARGHRIVRRRAAGRIEECATSCKAR